MPDAVGSSWSPAIDRSIAQLTALPAKFRVQADVLWRQAGEMFFAETQRVVHVYPINGGSLKASGAVNFLSAGDEVLVAEVSYGGPTSGPRGYVDYAVYEFGRGGDHDALARGFESSQAFFLGAAEKMLRAIGDDLGGRL